MVVNKKIPACRSHVHKPLPIAVSFRRYPGYCPNVSWLDQETFHPGSYEFSGAAGIICEDGQLESHSLKVDNGKPLVRGRQSKDVAMRIKTSEFRISF